MTFKISEDIKVELFGSTSFIIGQSKLGGPALLGDLTPTWHPLTCGVVSIDISRGFSLNQGILPSLEVGTASLVLSGFDVDPTLNPLFSLNSEIRILVRAPGAEFSPIFTGFVDDIQTQYAADGLITTNIQCTDWLSKILNITVDGDLYEVEEQNFAQRVNYILDTFVVPAYPNVEISPAWFDVFGGTIFPEETGLVRGPTTTGELLQELIDGEAGMIVASRAGVVYGFGRYYYDHLKEQIDLSNVGDDFGFSNTHSDSLDHFCMGDVETLLGKSEIVNEATLTFSANANAQPDVFVVKKNEVSIAALGNLPASVELYVSSGTTGDDTTYLQSWADDLTLPDGQTRVSAITWTPIRRDGLLNNAWAWDPGAKVTKVRIEYVSHTIDDKYIVSRINHNITPENWVITAELWKGI